MDNPRKCGMGNPRKCECGTWTYRLAGMCYECLFKQELKRRKVEQNGNRQADGDNRSGATGSGTGTNWSTASGSASAVYNAVSQYAAKLASATGASGSYTWGSYTGRRAIFQIIDDPVTPPAPLPVRKSSEAIRAYKWALPYSHVPKFRGISARVAYGIDDVAVCMMYPNHVPPVEGCTCGFYALKEAAGGLEQVSYQTAYVLLEVELYGRVIVHENGYRAARQRVMKIHLPATFMPDISVQDLASWYGTEVERLLPPPFRYGIDLP